MVVFTGRVGQWQTGITQTRQRIILRQEWVGDQRTISRGLGRENNPGARAGIRTQEIYLGILGKALYVARLNNTRQRAGESPELM